MTQTAQQQIDIDVRATSGGTFTVVPEDVYTVEFTEFQDGPAFPNRNDPSKMDQTIRLVYTILEGDYTGEKLDELASLKGGPQSKLRERTETLRGQPYGVDESIRLVPLYGKRAKAVVKVEVRENGERNKIESLVAMPPPRAGRASEQGTASPAAPAGRKF